MNPVSGSQANLSALRAFGVKSQVTANNVANVNTDGFQKSRVDLMEGAASGVEVSISKPGSPEKRGAAMVPLAGGPGESDNNQKKPSDVDIAEEMVSMMTTENFYSANTKMVQSKDAMLGTLIDMVG
jgi:flagellar basal-body rod protein FlgC